MVKLNVTLITERKEIFLNTRFYNAKILSFASDFSIITGELWVEGNRITYIGDSVNSPPVIFDREIDANGNLLMPGFKNAHTHSSMTFLRSYADGLPLLNWLNQQVFPMEAKLTGEDIYHLSKLAILEYLTSGITCCFDMYHHPEQVAQASLDMGFRTILCGHVNDYTGTCDENLTNLETWYQRYNQKEDLIGYRLGFHGEYTTSEPLLKGITGLSKKYKAPVYCHNSETIDEVKQCIVRNNATPTVYLDSLGLFEYGGGSFHSTHVSEKDMDIFKRNSISVITNPGSNVKLASGIAPIKQMVNKEINVAIGTDGPASNNCLDMFREMFLVIGLQNIKEQDAGALDANKVLYMATVGGAKAIKLEDCDILKEGKIADIILIDLQQPNMQPINNITKNIVYSGSKMNIKLTMVNGRILYENRNFYVGEEEEQIYKKANEIIQKLK